MVLNLALEDHREAEDRAKIESTLTVISRSEPLIYTELTRVLQNLRQVQPNEPPRNHQTDQPRQTLFLFRT